MFAFNLPSGVTLQSIDTLFEEADEDQCQDTESEEKTERALTPAEMAEIAELLNSPEVLACRVATRESTSRMAARSI